VSRGRKIVVAMSGGVDSSVAAALLAEQGEDVSGLMLRLWGLSDTGRANRCCSPADVADARQVASLLGIPFYVLDASADFKTHVIDYFLNGYAQGITPNPCLQCNRHIRWGTLLRHAQAFGATHLATGHYARLGQDDGRHTLLRGVDLDKDQSYVLSLLTQEQLGRAVFPLGELTKTEVREHARRLNLPVAERPESQDLCFVTDGDYREFLRERAASAPCPGPIVDEAGRYLGEHTGLSDYTIGQRKGLGIRSSQPLYVMAKDVATNTLVVGPRTALGRRQFRMGEVNWVSGEPPRPGQRVQVRVRYKGKEVWSGVRSAGDEAEVEMEQDLPDVTPGQAAVFYDGPICLGGGIIQP
jgi:tRNA-specific 2-thiouridylase